MSDRAAGDSSRDDRPTTRIRTTGSRVAYANPWMTVREDDIERVAADGTATPGLYAVIEKPRSAVIVPFDGERVHLVGQHRHPVDAFSWEWPQGALSAAADAALVARARASLGADGRGGAGGGAHVDAADRVGRDLDAAARAAADAEVARTELREETGLTAGRLERLGELGFAVGMSAQRFVAWLATELTVGDAEPEAEEAGMLVHRAVTVAEMDALVHGDALLDASTVAVWALARPHVVGDG